MNVEQFAKVTLENYGFNVDKIPESESETPDFLACKENETYLIEIKSKETDKEFLRLRELTLTSEGIWDETIALKRENKIKNIVRKSVSQLRSHPITDINFKLVWLHAAGHNISAQLDLFEASLYGTTTVGNFHDDDSLYKCYYFHESDFYYHRNTLDGAIITSSEGGKIFLNNHSVNYKKLKASSLSKAVMPAVIDPYEEETKKLAYIADNHGCRKETKETLKYLSKKYKRDSLTDVTMNHSSVEVRTY